MPFSHHSHSGQFCPGHAVDSLEDVVKTAICKKLHVLCFTEHMPRHDIDAYPEELESGSRHLESQTASEAAYFEAASSLRNKYTPEIQILIGFECDWIRPESRDLIERSIKSHSFDFFVGSVHHVHTIPIDYDAQMYMDARQKAGGTDEALFENYFDAQLDMLHAVKPLVVGHFDLIRLKSDNPNANFRALTGVWQRILRNLDFVASYGGILELNTAALRKGMAEPYPQKDICQEALHRGIRFCLSDDSHGTSQVAYGYKQALNFLRTCGVERLHYLKHVKGSDSYVDARFPNTELHSTDLTDLDFDNYD